MSFKTIFDQEKAREILLGQLKSRRIPHAFLFLGPDGVGRRTTAMELAKALNCHEHEGSDPCDHCLSCQKIDKGIHPDVRTIDFAWQAKLENKEIEKQKIIKIDTIRSLQREISMKPTEGKWKVFLIEPAEKITLDAANCLLKTLEEPPAWTVLILLAKHRENLPATVVSRTQIVPFRPLRDETVITYLTTKLTVERSRAQEVARLAEGSLSCAIELARGKTVLTDSPWQTLKDGLADADLLDLSQQHAKTAAEFLDELLAEAKHDFRRSPARYRATVEAIIASQKFLEKNVNAQMVLDALFLQLNRHLHGRNAA
jgi:DNA polymerase-3 subunit delta'